MRIGIDSRIWGETTGRYVRNLVSSLSEIDNKNDYFIFVPNKLYDEIKKSNSSSNFTFIPTKIKWHTLDEQLNFSKEINKYDLDLMHFTYFSIPIKYSKPYVVTIHDLIIHHFPTGKASTLPAPIYYLKRLAYMFIIKKAAQNSKAIISVSNATKDEIIDHLHVPTEKIKVIYEGVDVKTLENSNKKIIDGDYILYVGNAYPHKNLNKLVDAFSISKKEEEKLVLVGRENYFYKNLKKYVEDKKITNILFFGEATDQELSSLYKNAKAYIMPSLMEGFGLPPIEAMANSCFVLASDIPSLKEICSDAAMYFNPYEVLDISNKIEFAFSNKSKQEYIKKGLNRVKSFSWRDMAIKTLKVYEDSFSLRQSK